MHGFDGLPDDTAGPEATPAPGAAWRTLGQLRSLLSRWRYRTGRSSPGTPAPNTLASGTVRPNTLRVGSADVRASRPAGAGSGSSAAAPRAGAPRRAPAIPFVVRRHGSVPAQAGSLALNEAGAVVRDAWSTPNEAGATAAAMDAAESAGDDFIRRLAHMQPDQAWRLASLWAAVDPAAREHAHRALREAAARHGRLLLLRHVQQAVLQWGSSGYVATEISIPSLGRRLESGDAQAAAARAALDAGSALVLRDCLDAADFATLVGPWEEIQG